MHEVSKRVLFRAMLKGGMSKAAISRELGISRRTATRWATADSGGRGHEALSYGPRTTGSSILDPYKEIVRIRLSEYPDLSAVRVFRELRESGYRGSYDVVKRYVRQVRPQPGKEPVVRFETAPGRQGQVDFAEFPLPWGKRYALLVVLGFSRLLWFQFFERQTMEVLMRGLEAAFAYFGGVPWELLFDQMKAVIIEDHRASAGELLRNAEFERFSHHHGFVIRACRPYRARTKGKVERPIRYLRDAFFYGREFASDEDLNDQALRWLETVANVRMHRTLKEVPRARFERERFLLGPLADRPYSGVVDEIGYLPVTRNGATLFFQLINERYERASTVLTSNKGFEEWGTILGDEVMAAALLDRLLHHCHIVNIRGNSYRMRDRAGLAQALHQAPTRKNPGEEPVDREEAPQ